MEVHTPTGMSSNLQDFNVEGSTNDFGLKKCKFSSILTSYRL